MRLIYFDIFPDTGLVKVNGNKSTDVSKRKYQILENPLAWYFKIINFSKIEIFLKM